MAVTPVTQAQALEHARGEGGYAALQWERRQQQRPQAQPGGNFATSPSPPTSAASEAKEMLGELPLAEIQWRQVHADADKVVLKRFVWPCIARVYVVFIHNTYPLVSSPD